MNVVMVAGDFPPSFGGVCDYTDLLTRELAALGTQVLVVTKQARGCSSRSCENGVQVRRIISDWGMREAGLVLDAVDEMGPGTIVNLQYGGYATHRRPMVTLLPAMLRLLRPQVRIVVTMHEFRGQRPHWKAWTLPMLLAAHGIICVDPPDVTRLAPWTALSRPRMTSIAIAPSITPVPVTSARRERWRRHLGVEDGRAIITFFGRIYEGKGFADLLRTVHQLQNAGHPLCLLVIGERAQWAGRTSRYESDVLGQGVREGWVRMAGAPSRRGVSRCLHASDVAVFPFTRGARTNRSSLLAAIAHGLPVITTRGVDTPDGFGEQFGVTLVPAGDLSSLGACLKSVLASHDLKGEMKARARKAATAFSWPTIAQATADFYRSLSGASLGATK